MEAAPAVVVVVVPLPAQSHLNQLLNFSRLVSERGIPVHYVGSATHNRQAKHRVQGWDPARISNIQFHDFPLPFHKPPPDPNALNQWATHLLPTFEAAHLNFREPLAELLRSLSLTARRVVVVHDSLMAFAAKEASSIPNGEAYYINTGSAFCVLFFKWEALLGRPSIPEIESLDEDLIDLKFDGCIAHEYVNFVTRQIDLLAFDVGELNNTCRPLEGKFIDILAQEPFLEKTKRQWAIGPLNPVVALDSAGGTSSSSSILRHKCLEWLDRQPPNSVLYVSFGTMTSLSNEQIREMAIGLERSEQRFIWVLREADCGDVYANQDDEVRRRIELPEGYEERVKGVGMIVRDWAPQLQILAHESTGGFLTQCGWNSCIESLSLGVPVAAWPMLGDQPRNTLLVSKLLRVGFAVREWANKDEVASSTVIENAVRKLMVSEDGKDMRRRAEELGVAIRQAVSKDGTSTAELDSFLTHISRP
ncbi:UDP-glucuronosyl/UDP-glucosyltransferase [Macleaya cordata]|uniref:Glycosyltransferase n=1 Tax=Macleaya cordata TaxID=56857 RepID=A0A200R725_MACCD|nr:UDP-glucuronosyl/UDP-glucosyltransferase [Macleaya cordata]